MRDHCALSLSSLRGQLADGRGRTLDRSGVVVGRGFQCPYRRCADRLGCVDLVCYVRGDGERQFVRYVARRTRAVLRAGRSASRSSVDVGVASCFPECLPCCSRRIGCPSVQGRCRMAYLKLSRQPKASARSRRRSTRTSGRACCRGGVGCLCDDGAALDDPINMVTSVASAMRRLGFELIRSTRSSAGPASLQSAFSSSGSRRRRGWGRSIERLSAAWR